MSYRVRVLALLTLALPLGAQSLKLNGPLARDVVGEIGFPPQTSPDGRFHVYTADRDGDQSYELYSAPSGGVHPPLLLAPVSVYVNAQVTRDSSSVLFDADLDGNGYTELAKVPIDGSAPPTALSGMPASGNAYLLGQSHDGARVLYLQEVIASAGLFSVPIDGGVPVKLNGPESAVAVVLSKDDRVLLYSAVQETDGPIELFLTSVDGSTPARKLPIALVPGGSVGQFELGPDGSRVFYSADQEEDERYEVFSIASDGSEAPRKLNGPLGPGGDVGQLRISRRPCPQDGCGVDFTPSFFVSPDGQWVVYTANQDALERFELYSVPSDGSRAPTKLSASPDRDVGIWSLTFDSAWVLYHNDPQYQTELFSVPVDGSSPAHRIGSFSQASRGPFWRPEVSFDSRLVVFPGRDETGRTQLYSAPVDGSAGPTQLSPPSSVVGSFGLNSFFWVLPGGVAYRAEQEHAGIPELHLVPASGGAPSRLLASGPIFDSAPSDSRASFTLFDEILFTRRGELFSVELAEPARPTLLDELPEGAVVVGDVEGFDLAPSGELVVYTALETDDLAPALYSVSTSKPQERVRILPEPQGQPLGSPRLVPDGNRVLFLRTSEYSADNDLYSAPSDGSGAPVVLDAALGASARVFDFQITPDGRRVVIEAFVDDRYSLYSAPADGASAPVLLYPSRFEYVHQLSRAKISADSSRIAFLEELRLYAAPIDGSSPAVLLTADSVAPDFQLTADGSQVVFRKANGRLGLFVVPADRSSAPRRLDAPMQPRAAVASFTLAPDSSRVVYLGDQAADETFELFSVPLDGSAPPVRLHPALAEARDVLPGFEVSSDGQRVVYRSDALADEALDLFSVPLDASRPPLLLSPGRIPAGDVLEFRISPDGHRVVYRADRESDERVELYSVSIRGGRSVRRLSRALVPGGDVLAFQISADSSTVAFTAQRDAARHLTLLAAPIGGEKGATELAGPFAEAGTIHAFALAADGSRVVWRAEQDEPGVIELYTAPYRPSPTPSLR